MFSAQKATGGTRPEVLQILARPGGGSAILVILLVRELNRLGCSTSLVTGNCDPLDLDMSHLLQADDAVERIPEMSGPVSLRNDLIALWRLYRLIRTLRPAIVQTHTAKAGLLGRIAARLAGVPVVIHTFHGNVMSGYFPPYQSRAIQFVERQLARLTNRIFVLCPQQEQDLVDRFRITSRAKIDIVPPGVDLEPFRRIAPPEDENSWLTVGWLGRLVAVKDVALLVEVMRETIRADDRIRFIVAGDGPQRALLEEAAKRWPNERLDWLGWTRDVEGVISRCDVLIQTSRNEGTPVALIQGMAAGRPFVSTPAGGVVDMVSGQGRSDTPGSAWFANAVLVEPGAHAFVPALRRLRGDRKRLISMGREAAAFAAASYDLRTVASNCGKLYARFLREEGMDEHNMVRDGIYQIRKATMLDLIRTAYGMEDRKSVG